MVLNKQVFSAPAVCKINSIVFTFYQRRTDHRSHNLGDACIVRVTLSQLRTLDGCCNLQIHLLLLAQLFKARAVPLPELTVIKAAPPLTVHGFQDFASQSLMVLPFVVAISD